MLKQFDEQSALNGTMLKFYVNRSDGIVFMMV